MSTHNRFHQFDALFSPQSIAIVGASENPEKIGSVLLRHLLPFQGNVFPINPQKRTMFDIPAYPSVTAIPGEVDVAVIAVPQPSVKAVVTDCAAKGVKFSVLITSGFGEIGRKAEEMELLQIAQAAGMRLIGPNCVGYGNAWQHVNASFLRTPEAGGVSLIAQSGGNMELLFAEALQGHVGFAKYIAIGNALDMHFDELLPYLADDHETTCIGVYLESVRDGQTFLPALEYASRKKPVIVLKGGVSSAGRQATISHTGNLSTTADIYRALLKQLGVLQVATLEEMIDAFNVLRLPPMRGKQVAVLTNSGGLGVIATDLLEQAGLTIPTTPEAIQNQLKQALPEIASVHNPCDLTVEAPATDFVTVLKQLAASASPDAFFFPYSCPGYRSVEVLENFADHIVQALQALQLQIPFAACNLPGTTTFFKQRFEAAGLPCFTTLSRGVNALSMLAQYSNRACFPRPPISQPGEAYHVRTVVLPILERAFHEQRVLLNAEESRMVLRQGGFNVPRWACCATLAECLDAASHLTFPLVMKISSPSIVHKSDVGGVITNIHTPQELQDAFLSMMSAVTRHVPKEAIQGVLLSEQIPSGQELLLGIKRDPVFGSFIMVGLGGIFVEVFQDVALRLAPIAHEEAATMLTELHAAPLFSGVRGQIGIDVPAVLEDLIRLSQLAAQCPEIQELDLNPVIALPPGQGCHVADVRIVVKQES